jgi:hypothetical protein
LARWRWKVEKKPKMKMIVHWGDEGKIKIYSFDSFVEMRAFARGVGEAVGWLSIDKYNTKNLTREQEKEVYDVLYAAY